MSSEKIDKKALIIRPASEFEIDFPDAPMLEKEEQKKIQNAITTGGLAIGTKTYVNSRKVQTLLNTDKKGVNIVINESSNDDVKRFGKDDYLSTPQIQKEIAKRKEQPRSMLEREKLKYSGQCLEAFSNNTVLNKERTMESDRIINARPTIGAKTLRERKSVVSELSGKPLDGKARVHHKNRVADKPEEALDKGNLTVITEAEHHEFHSSEFPQNERGYEDFKKTKMREKV